MARAAAAEQVPMRYSQRGGARLGAGRPKKKGAAGASHAARKALTGHEPVHVSIRIRDEVWRLRSQRCFRIVCAALAAACNRPDFRIVGCSVQDSHLHLLIEAADARSLARGMQALSIRVAKGLNRLMDRRGKVFAGRYFPNVLTSPEEVRRVQRYVFRNRANHLARLGRRVPEGFRDPLAIGYFGPDVALPSRGPTLVVEPRTWLLSVGRKRAIGGSTKAASTESAATRSVAGNANPAPDEGSNRTSCTPDVSAVPWPLPPRGADRPRAHRARADLGQLTLALLDAA